MAARAQPTDGITTASAEAIHQQAPELVDTAAAPGALGTAAIDREAFHHFPYSLLVTRQDGTIVSRNLQATRLIEAEGLVPASLTCCELLGCGTADTVLAQGCITAMALAHGSLLPEIRIDLETRSGTSSLWIAAAPMGGNGSRPTHVALQLRPGIAKDRRRRTEPHWISGPRLRIRALGGVIVESPEGPIGGDWLDQRAGKLLKYLVAERHRSVPVEQIGESVWPQAGYSIAGSVRYYIHALRSKLEPARPKRGPSSFILSRAGGYRLNLDRVTVDADEFESRVSAGLAARQSEPEVAEAQLESGLALYRGEFLADLPYAEWALAERHRLLELACRALRELADLRLERRMPAAAMLPLERLAAMQPYDEAVHRQLMELDMASGQHSNAMRRYGALRTRIRRTFGHDLSFTPAELKTKSR
jgi:DNA-binding SARP family transcriptional activator